MRIWSLHPRYLDVKGIVALWREALLAKHVLLGKTKGYKNHPQLNRFKKLKHPVDAIDQYLDCVFKEAVKRGYNFDERKITRPYKKVKLNVSDGQVNYESKHLMGKLKQRDQKLYKQYRSLKDFEPHPMFKIVKGEIEDWEII